MSSGLNQRWQPWRDTMVVEAQVSINGSKAAIWAAMTDIEDAPGTIRGKVDHRCGREPVLRDPAKKALLQDLNDIRSAVEQA